MGTKPSCGSRLVLCNLEPQFFSPSVMWEEQSCRLGSPYEAPPSLPQCIPGGYTYSSPLPWPSDLRGVLWPVCRRPLAQSTLTLTMIWFGLPVASL